MAAPDSDAPRRLAQGGTVLEHVARVLSPADRTDESFTPDKVVVHGELPGRKRGESLATRPAPVAGPGAVILDCGTSRRHSFTHVLWISHAAPAILGARAVERFGHVLNTLDGVEACEWEGDEHLHVRAPNYEHADLLRQSRALVAQLLA